MHATVVCAAELTIFEVLNKVFSGAIHRGTVRHGSGLVTLLLAGSVDLVNDISYAE